MKFVFAAAMPLLAVACAPLPPLDTSVGLVSVADTASPVSTLQAGPAVTYRSRAVQEPGNWIDLNNAQGPGVE
ncbi:MULTISPECIES: hypothetical protein [Paracoccus]|uniref:Uncharacterized protein n=1 Tax=Paracoccus hibiscisoli TaxID=2023261 RepID=A0A4U0QLF6_9RHOB|nr:MULTISPECIES: hypothetical protein [Paracoccus]KIX16393.1 hypothetical protein SY26_18540 [Paracoccus sp. 228]ODT64659.1 MAG: hypothetical protein ABS75_34320 [Pelagibacterium sp. SCN 63-23]TJZ76874.1 hypothetical protein FA740_19285 [Paracoccus hibiscisoli]